MAGIEQRNPEEDLLFEGEKINCKNKLLSEDVFVYGGYWKYKGYENKAAQHGWPKWENTKLKKEAAIRRIRNEDCLDDWKNMADKLMELKHNNILRVFGYEEDTANGCRYFALQPYSATLYEYCTGQYKDLMPNESQVLYQITSGIRYLHDNRIIHGDLNPLNIFIAAQSRPVRMKISDPGLSKFSYSKQLSESVNEEEFSDGGSSSDDGEYLTRKGLELCQSKYWTLSEQFNDIGKHVNDDFLAAACILFYYLKRGKHLFGNDSQSILINLNLKEKNPANLKNLDEKHVAYEPIKNLIFPPSNGLHSLFIKEFEKNLSLKVDEKKELGKGTYGIVYEGKYNGDAVAVKRIPTNESEKKFIQREMKEHVGLIHDNVVKLWEVSDSANNQFTHLVLELCAGTLQDYCKNKYKGPMPLDELVLYQIANGLDYIHSRNLVHRDIKPDNILISMTTPVQMKVSDLSFVKQTNENIFSQSEARGALLWMAPERLVHAERSDTANKLPYGTIESDIFSTGCVFFYFLKRGLHAFGEQLSVAHNIKNNNPTGLIQYEKEVDAPHPHFHLCAIIRGMIRKEIKNENATEQQQFRIGLADVIKQLATLLSTMAKIKCQLRRIETSVGGDKGSCFHPIEPILACVGYEGLIFYTAENSSIPFSNWRKEVKRQRQNLHQGFVTSLKWNINGTQLAVVYEDGNLMVLNYPKCDIVFQKEHSDESYQIEWNPIRHNVLATFYFLENDVLIWNSLTGDVIIKIDCEYVRAVEWISENRIAVSSCGADSAIHIFEMKENHSITTTRVLKHGYYSCYLEWNERTQYLASWGGEDIKIWSMDSDEPIYSLHIPADDKSLYKLAWRPCVRNGQQDDDEIEKERKSSKNFDFVYYRCPRGTDSNLFTWNPLKNEQKPQLLYDKEKIRNLTFSSDGRFLATVHYAEVIIWSAENWNQISNINNKGLSEDISWLCTPTSTNLYQSKLICQSSYFVVFEFEFAYEENKIPDSASGTLVKSEEDITDLK